MRSELGRAYYENVRFKGAQQVDYVTFLLVSTSDQSRVPTLPFPSRITSCHK
jgi:hypothetical protein